MQRFTARLEGRPGIYSSMLGQLPKSIELIPRKWSAADIGGPKAATIDAVGTVEDLSYLLTWLGNRAIIENEMSSPVWWGVVYEIEANLGNVTVSLNLESVFNRVAVIYPYVLPDGSTESRRTAWAEDNKSIARYGQRELLYSLPDGVDENAEAVRDRLLTQFADPAPVISTRRDNKVGATLYCRGQWSLLDFVYWTNELGLAAHEDFGGGVQLIGASYTATTISFGGLAATKPGGDDGKDDISDVANGFGALVEGTVFRVSGAAQTGNNGIFTVQALHGSDRVETVENNQVDEAAGATVTIALGEFGMVGWVAQSFAIPVGWTATKVALRVQRVGNPVDNLDFRIHADGGGSPGTTIALGSIAGSSVPTAMNWVAITLNTPVALSPGTTYWVEVGRSGATSLADYYIVALDEGLGHSGSMKVYTGSNSISGSWVTRDSLVEDGHNADMPFRIIGEVDSITQLRSALSVSPEFTGIVGLSSSGVMVRSYRGDDTNVLDEVLNLLDLGTSTGDRLIAHVNFGRQVVIEIVPDSSPANLMLGADGQLRHASGALVEPGKLVVGKWIDIEALPVLDGLNKTKGQRAVYVKECEFDAASNRLMIQSDGAPDPWQAIHWEKR